MSYHTRVHPVYVFGGVQFDGLYLGDALITNPSDGIATQTLKPIGFNAHLFGLSEIFEVGAAPDPLSATISGPETYSGGFFPITVRFNYPLDVAEALEQIKLDFKEHALDVENGTVTGVFPILTMGELGKIFRVSITPTDSYRDVVITLDSSIACGQPGAICATVSNSKFTLDEAPTLTVQRSKPAIDSLRITSVPDDGVAYRVGESITATVWFDESIAVVADEAPVLMLEFPPDATKKSAVYSGPGAAPLTLIEILRGRGLNFEYEVEVGESHSGVGIAANALNTNPVTAFAASGKSDFHPNSLLSNAVAPNSQTVDGRVRISDVAITSDPGTDLTYHKGDEVEVTVTFERAVDVHSPGGKRPHFELTLENPPGSGIANSTVEVPYSDAGSSESDGVLKYRYEVAAGDMGLQGISIPSNPLSRNSILVMGTVNTVNYGFAGLATNVLHKVDGSEPASTNTSATGAVTIEGTDMDGTVRVGYTLSADTSGIMDANGMPATDTYDYEWLRSGVLIAGAEASDYTVVDADLGETLSVRVNFTDSAGFSESLRSAETSSVLPAILDHDPTLTIRGGTVDEDDGEISFTVTLGEVHGLEVSVDYTTADRTAVAGDDYEATNGTLTFAPGESEKTIAVTIIEDLVIESVYAEKFAVELSNPVNAVLGNSRASGNIRDSTDEPELGLMVDSTEIAEAGGSATVTVSITNDVVFDRDRIIYLGFHHSDATRGVDFTPSHEYDALRLVAGSSTFAPDELVAVQDTIYEGDESIVISISGIAGSLSAPILLQRTVTIIDDDELPVATLQLSPDSIAENGGLSTVTATLSGKSSKRVSVTVSAAAVSPAVAADFELSTNKTLTIAAGTTASSGAVTIAAVNNGVDAPDKKVTVSGSLASGGLGIAAPSNETLTIVDDEATPTATLILTPDSIGENGGESTVTAALDHPSSAETTLTVSATAGANTVAGDFALSDNTTLTIDAGMTTSSGAVTITAVNNSVDDSNKEVTVSASEVTNSQGVTGPADLKLTIEDDEGAPTASLILTPDSIGENGGESTVTVTLSHASNQTATLTVATMAGSNTVDGDYTLSGNTTLTINAGDTSSTGTVTITAVDNDIDNPNKRVTVGVGGQPSGIFENFPIPTRDLTIVDNEDPPTVTLQLSPTVINENGGVSTVTATLSHPSSADTEVTISEIEGVFAVSANKTLTIPAGAAKSTEEAKIDAVDNNIYGDPPIRSVMVTAVADNDLGVVRRSTVSLMIRDNEDLPTVTLHLSPDLIGEKGGSSTVTATLSHPANYVAEVTVSATGVFPTRAADFELSDNKILTIAAGDTQSTGSTVTIIAIDNEFHGPKKNVSVTGQAPNFNIAAQVLTLVIEEDEKAPTVTLVLDRDKIYEGESTGLSATLSHPSSSQTTITVSAVYSYGDYTFSDFSLTIAAGATESTETETIEAVDNEADNPDITQTFSATAVNSQGLASPPSDVVLTILDNEDPPAVTLHLSPDSIDEDGGSSTVTATLSHTSSAETTITVSAAAVSPAVAADFALSADTVLTIAAYATTSTGTVTIGAVNNGVDAQDKVVKVQAGAANMQGVTAPEDLPLTLVDDEPSPTAVLHLTQNLIDEDGGSTTVTATLSHASSAPTTITVSAMADLPAVATDFTLSMNKTLVISAGETSSTGTVTIAAADNDIDDPDKAVTVSAVANNDLGVEPPLSVNLFILDNEPRVEVTLELSPLSIAENGGSSTVTATLSGKSSAVVSVTVSATAGTNTVSGDFTLSNDVTLTIAAGATASTGTVTIEAVDNNSYGLDKVVAVTGSVNEDANVTPPQPVALSITENEMPPQIGLSVDPAEVSEGAGSTTVTVTATLDGVVLALDTAVRLAVRLAGEATDDTAGTDSETSFTDLSESSSNAGTVFEAVENFEVTIGALETSGTADFTLTPVDDDVDEPDDTLQLSGATTLTGVTVNPVSVTIVDDDLPQVSIAAATATVAEGEDAQFTLTRAGDTAVALTVTLATTASPNDVVSATLPTQATFAEGDDTVTLNIATVDDAVDEAAGQVTVTIQATATAYRLLADPASATVTILDDDLPQVSIAATAATVDEGEDAQFTLTRAGDTAVALTVTIQATFKEGDATVMLSIVTVDDAVDEADGQVTVTIQAAATAYRLLADAASATVAVTDNDAPGGVSLSVAPASVSEGGGDQTVTVTAAFTGSTTRTQPTVVTVSVKADTAQAGDFTAVEDFEVTIDALETSGTADFTLTPVDDDVDEPDETLTVSGTTALDGVTVNPARVTIVDDDLPQVSIAATAATVAEGEDAQFTLTRVGDTAVALTVTIQAAAEPTDVVSSMSGTLPTQATFKEGDATVMLSIVTVDDAVDEADGQVTVTIQAAATAYRLVADAASATVTIVDDDLPQVSIAAATATVAEGENAQFTLTRAGDTAVALTVTIQAAASPNDVVSATLPTQATFAEGDDTVTLNIATVDDAVDEADG